MDTKELLHLFFEAENRRDWESYRQFLHPEIAWQLWGREIRRMEGVEEYLSAIQKAYEDTQIRFSCQHMEVSRDGSRVIAYLINDEGLRSFEIFDFKDGRIYREYEFLLDEELQI